MKPFNRISGIVAPLDATNVDTDQIIPKQFLKRIGRTGYEDGLFLDWRFLKDGSPNPAFELNAQRYEGASILLTRANFGCGSSREHAPWALHDYGFRVIIAASYADNFYNNCFNNGMLPIVLPMSMIEIMFQQLRANEGYKLTVDLKKQAITDPDGTVIAFKLDGFLRERLLNGWDQIGLTLRHEDKISAYEGARGIG